MSTQWMYLLAALVAFAAVGLKGFQHKNVIGGHTKSVVITSYIIAAFDVVSVSLVVKGGLEIIPHVGTGAALGMYVAIKFHDRLFGRKDTT